MSRWDKLTDKAIAYFRSRLEVYGQSVCDYAKTKGLDCGYYVDGQPGDDNISLELWLSPRAGALSKQPVFTSLWAAFEPTGDDSLYASGSAVSMHPNESWGQLAEDFFSSEIRRASDIADAYEALESLAEPEAIVDTVSSSMRGHSSGRRLTPGMRKTKRRLMR